jgi:hypothetical protein
MDSHAGECRMQRDLLGLFLLATTPVWLFPLSGILAWSSSHLVSEIGHFLTTLDMAGLFGLFAALGVFFTSPILLFFRRYRRYAVLSLVFAVIFVPCELLGIYWGSSGRDEKIERVAERGQPIVDAIKAYEKKNGHPPSSLDELVPDYLDSVPTTAIGAWPEFYYRTRNPNRHEGNEWDLSAIVPGNPGFGLAPGDLMYYPRQNYPEGSILIGTWQYYRKPD